MPRTAEMPVCGAAKIFCVNDAEDSLLLQRFELALKSSDVENIPITGDCNCLPSCSSIVYETEVSMAEYDFASQFRAFKADDYVKENPGTQITKVLVSFKEDQFMASKRSELYGTTDFLANCGGLLGLFMGVSTLSIVELLYFCTVRLFINLRMRRKKNREMRHLDETIEEGFHARLELPGKQA
ncbi:pickpocket protein 28-like [Episyrphus balteatus]|uniref:pickpocket protein 28-like n=1 Tax=Episyrphus balteatus TaxID=286459 RepID=UPI00248694C5|nr:pickpocket protein 28-like [Episyrphus balteatus]